MAITALSIDVKDAASATQTLQTPPSPFIVSTTFTTTSSTSAHATGALVANSATAGSVSPMSFTIGRANGGIVVIERARFQIATDTGFANQPFVLHLYNAAPTCTNGSGLAWLTTISGYLDNIPITLDRTMSDASFGVGVPSKSDRIIAACGGASQIIYGLLATAASVTPQAGSKLITVTLEGYQF